MAEILTVLGTIGSQVMSAAATAGSFAAANAGTIGTLLTAGSTIYGGLAANAQGKAIESQMKTKGDNEFAVAQRDSLRRKRETDLLLSRQKAVAAASGGGATDPTVMSVMGKTQQEGDYNAMIDMYNGSVNRADLYKQGAVARAEGKSKMWGSFLDAGSTIYSGLPKKKNYNVDFYTDELRMQ